ncbi:potassium channel family protein [Metamycoplasma buccale]|uniref:potassium channel family protein n=1 Tax=Metamycoplasma buccale TaxID=55602 RepID=UPI00398F093A
MSIFKKSREICIIGLGRLGTAIADQLIFDHEHNIKVVLVDKDEKHLTPFKDEVDSIYVADAAEIKTLQAINIDSFDVVIVATSDNIEIVAALVETGVKKVIARASSKRHANVLKQIGVTTIINPENETGHRIALLVANPSFSSYSEMLVELQDGYVTGSTYVKNPKINNIKIKDLGFRNKYDVSIVLVKRGTESFLPEGDFMIKEGDLLTLVGLTDNITKVLDLCAK